MIGIMGKKLKKLKYYNEMNSANKNNWKLYYKIINFYSIY